MESINKNLEATRNMLTQKRYSESTISSYLAALRDLFSFYSNIPPDEISFDKVSDYVSYLITRKNAANSTIRIHLAAFNLYFNTLHNRNYAIQSLKLPFEPRKIPEILTIDEVKRLLASAVVNIKHHAVLSLIYSAGLEVSQALRISLSDVDFVDRQIKVRDSKGIIQRTAMLAEILVSQLQYYIDYCRPEKWLFEGQKGQKLSASSVQKAFKRAQKSASIDKHVSVRSLKYSYVKHVESYGVPLPIVLKELGISNSESINFYSFMGLPNENVSFSPLDRILHESSDERIDISSLEKSFAKLQNADEKSYLLEAIKCLNARAPRATVVVAWNAAIRNIQYRCLKYDSNTLNIAIKKHHPKAPRVEVVNDFEKIKERITLEASQTLGIFSKGEKNNLIGCLDLRNQCGHPGAYIPDELQVAAFLENLYNIVFSKPSPYPSELDLESKKYKKYDTYEDDGLPF